MLTIVAQNIPVPCEGVMVYPEDIIVGDADGVVIPLRRPYGCARYLLSGNRWCYL
ncbi:MAG: RraA family protein [Desulfitobacteriaceae bacterium]